MEDDFEDREDHEDTGETTYNADRLHIFGTPSSIDPAFYARRRDAKNRFKAKGWEEGDFLAFEDIRDFLKSRRHHSMILIDVFPCVQRYFPTMDPEHLTHLLIRNNRDSYGNAQHSKVVHSFDIDGTLFRSEIPLYDKDDSIRYIKDWHLQHPWCDRCNKRHTLPWDIYGDWRYVLTKIFTKQQVLERLTQVAGVKINSQVLTWFIQERKFPQAIKFIDNKPCKVWSVKEIEAWIELHHRWLQRVYHKTLVKNQRKQISHMMRGVIKEFGALIEISEPRRN